MEVWTYNCQRLNRQGTDYYSCLYKDQYIFRNSAIQLCLCNTMTYQATVMEASSPTLPYTILLRPYCKQWVVTEKDKQLWDNGRSLQCSIVTYYLSYMYSVYRTIAVIFVFHWLWLNCNCSYDECLVPDDAPHQ